MVDALEPHESPSDELGALRLPGDDLGGRNDSLVCRRGASRYVEEEEDIGCVMDARFARPKFSQNQR